MDELIVTYFNGQNIVKAAIRPEHSKKCPLCGDPLGFHVCKSERIKKLEAEVADLKATLDAISLGA